MNEGETQQPSWKRRTGAGRQQAGRLWRLALKEIRGPLPTGGGRQQAGRLWRLVLKELREILRDRRTIVTLVVMPVLIYPLLAVVFQRFLFTSLSGNEEITYV